jgi:hypothetical protein
MGFPLPTAPAVLGSGQASLVSGDLTITNTVFADVDASLNLSVATGARKVLVIITCAGVITTAQDLCLDVAVDGVRLGGTDGLEGAGSTNRDTAWTIAHITDVLTPGVHTFKPQVRVTGGTGTLYASGTAPFDFSVAELLT